MDIVVADVPPKYGMLLSRSWGAKLQGTMQMDMTYATIPIFNQTRRLYRESHMQYMVSNQERPKSSPIYSVHTSLDSFILFNHEISNEQETLTNLMATPHYNIIVDTKKEEDKTKRSK